MHGGINMIGAYHIAGVHADLSNIGGYVSVCSACDINYACH